MSKSSKLSTAIKAFNVSECVKDYDGKIVADWCITEDLDVWAGLEVHTVDDLEAWLNFKQGFSDFHKEVHGMRPRFDTSEYTLSMWRQTYEFLKQDADANATMEAERERLNVQSFKDAVRKIRQSGAKDFMTAVRWMLQAEDINPRNRMDVEQYFWEHGILYSEYGQSLIKRISPQRKR